VIQVLLQLLDKNNYSVEMLFVQQMNSAKEQVLDLLHSKPVEQEILVLHLEELLLQNVIGLQMELIK
jgi:hypothetical protein